MIPPKYVMFKSDKGNYSALELRGKEYYRVAGEWSCRYKIQDDKIIAILRGHPQINGKELVEVTEAEWRKDNEGYV